MPLRDTYYLTHFQIILERASFSIQINRAPVPDFMDAALSNVLLRSIESHKLAEAVIRAQSLLQAVVIPLGHHRVYKGT